jgi:hypothetical protein
MVMASLYPNSFMHILDYVLDRLSGLFRYSLVEKTLSFTAFRAYVWSAVDVDSGDDVIYASWMKLLRMVLGRCLNKPLVDSGPWYRWALERPD